MNVRKPVDYSTMYRELTASLTQNLLQMDEVYAIGKAISQRPEKGAAVAAAEFLQANFPDRTGFSPRNVCRMRDFYRTYENDQPWTILDELTTLESMMPSYKAELICVSKFIRNRIWGKIDDNVLLGVLNVCNTVLSFEVEAFGQEIEFISNYDVEVKRCGL